MDIGIERAEWIVSPVMLNAITPVGASTRMGDYVLTLWSLAISQRRSQIILIKYDLPVPAVPIKISLSGSTRAEFISNSI